MPARMPRFFVWLILLAAANLAAAALFTPGQPACDPSKASCLPGTEKKACEPVSCLESLEERARFEKENNCTFKCSNTITEISTAVLRQIFTSATEERLADIATELNATLKNTLVKGLIDTKRKLAHFLAQVKQEVGPTLQLTESLNYLVEDLVDPKKGPFAYFKKHPEEAEKYGRKVEWVEEIKTDKKGNPVIGKDGKPVKIKVKKVRPADQEAIANRAYAGRMGNGDIASGDGWKYRGRGLIQLTGKANYEDFNTVYKKVWPDDTLDFVTNPELVGEGKYAVLSALTFWKHYDLDKIAEKGVACTEADKITAKINKHTKSYAARCSNLKAIMKLPFFKECDALKDLRQP